MGRTHNIVIFISNIYIYIKYTIHITISTGDSKFYEEIAGSPPCLLRAVRVGITGVEITSNGAAAKVKPLDVPA